MEISSDAEKQLHENLQKCRCCFRMLIDDRRALSISDEVRDIFLFLTGIQLLDSDIFADRICQLCSSDLKVFANLRDDLIVKQKTLYALAGIDEDHFTNKSVPLEQMDEDEDLVQEDDNSQDFDLNFETVEDAHFEDEMEGEFINEDTAEAEEEATTAAEAAVIKIEKVQDGSEETLVTDFDFFEEIVGDEEGMDEESTYEMVDSMKDEFVSCDVCGIELSTSHLNQHIQVMHKTFICKQCDKKFQSKISLRRHALEVHHADKAMRSKRRHFCPLCPKDYDYKKQLDDHIRSFHEKERNAQCHICNKTFYHRDLKKHIEHVHGDKNVACETCGKLYTCIENLRLHMRYHLPPSFTCSFPDCGKKFHQKVLWEHHEKKHSQEKPVSCEHCGASFYSLRDVKRHQQRVHEKVTRKCNFCEVSFSRKDKYRQHVLKKHKELSEEQRDQILEHIRTMKWNE